MNIIESTMVSICREMGITMMKTSYSTIFNEGLDFTCGLGNTRGELIGVAEFNPLADRRIAAHPADLGPGNSPRRGRGRRCHRPQRPLPGRHAHARAHLHQARVLPGRADGLRRRHRPCGGGRRHGSRRLRRRGHRDLPRGHARAPGQDQGAGRGRGRGVEAHARELPHAPHQLRRLPRAHQRRRRRRRPAHRSDREVRAGHLPQDRR